MDDNRRVVLLDAEVQKILAIFPDNLTPLEICAALVVVVFGLETAHRGVSNPHPDVARVIHLGKQLISEFIAPAPRES
jgi:hypothetical protein